MLLILAACAPAQPAQNEVADLRSQLDQLQVRQDELAAQLAAMQPDEHTESESHADDPFAVSVAQYFMDTAGFHGMAETISETHQIDPTYLGKVNRVHKVLASTPWPEALSEQGHSFISLLEDFAAVLDADDGEEAVEISEQVHDAQHDFSHAIDEWLGTADGH
jgi:hypothetical protein